MHERDLAAAGGTPQLEVRYEFNGPGQDVTPLFELNPGLAIFRATHNGEDQFTVSLLDITGETVELFMIISDGKFRGSKAVRIEKAGYKPGSDIFITIDAVN